MLSEIVIVDYGVGNLFNLCKAFRFLSSSVKISNDPDDLRRADGIVLPGVGNFGESVKNLEQYGIDSVLRLCFEEGKPMLGICLGMHLLFDISEEADKPGLGLLEGRVMRFDAESKTVPLIGWNSVSIHDQGRCDNLLFTDVPKIVPMYFAHSFFACPRNGNLNLAMSQYGSETFPAVIKKDSFLGFQFHPELSGPHGLSMLRNFLRFSA